MASDWADRVADEIMVRLAERSLSVAELRRQSPLCVGFVAGIIRTSHDAEVERLRDVEKAARSLIERMDELIQSDQHRSAGGCHIAECVPEEDSPTWIREACTLRHALSPFAQPGGEKGGPTP